MIQGTTPTHIFTIPMDTSEISKLRITYTQYGHPVIERDETHAVMDGKEIRVTLTQEETLKLDTKTEVRLQIKILTASGALLASRVTALPVGEILNKEILS